MKTQLCTFTLGELFLGVPVDEVQEVIRQQPMTPVPKSAPEISGLINLRGQIVTAIDLKQRLKLGPRAADAKTMNVVIRRDDGAVSLLVDEIGDVLDLAQSVLEPTPENIDAEAKALIRGVYKLEDRLLLVLDTEKVVAV